MIWYSFLLVNVQFFVWKVGEYLLLIIKIFVLFEKGTSCFISFSSQLKLLRVNCHAVCVVTLGRRTQKEKKVIYARLFIFTSNILLNCKRKFECGAEDDSSSKLYLFLPLLNLAQIFL